ncbi:MAG: ABC transporter permease [Anaerolineae bacterium]|nr:ABC transporter permease [Anaerolineae bacterium]
MPDVLNPTVLEITARSLQVTLSALAISAVVGVPVGAWLALARLPGKRLITALIYTGMGLPPVVVGLALYLLFSRSGPLGDWRWLFSVPAMVAAQTVIAVPLVVGVTMSSVLGIDPALRVQLRALGATRWQITRTILREARFGVIVGLVAGFGSIISEVGAVMIVGGNIEGRTRVLTTAIVLETNKGNFDIALALGAVLLTLSLAANLVAVIGQGKANTPA